MTETGNSASRFDFDAVAAQYDRWYETAQGRLFDRLEKRAVLRLYRTPGRGESLLEVGMGTGWWSRFFSGLGFEVTGIDVSPKMVETARSKDIPNAAFEMADAHCLPFQDGSFSVSVAVTTLEFTRNPEAVLREMARCTKPNGTILLGVLNADAPLNQERQAQPDGPFAFARLFTAEELYGLLSNYGRTTLRSCAFPVSMKAPPLACLIDDAMAMMKSKTGAFIATRTKR